MTVSARTPRSAAARIPDARTQAARALARVLSGQGLDSALGTVLTPLAEPRERAFAQRLVYTALRWAPRSERILAQLLRTPLPAHEHTVRALLWIGLAQLEHLATPAHAAVAATVQAAHMLEKSWAAGLINALLRRFVRERDALHRQLAAEPEFVYSHPAWLIEAIRRDWPQHWQDLLAVGNTEPPLALRVNRRRGNRAAYLQQLAAAGIAATPAAAADDGLILVEPKPITEIPGFAAGLVSVQDLSAQLAVPALALMPGMRLLDACSAPGGKLTHALEQADVDVLAVDCAFPRLARVRDNLARLGLAAPLVAGDATAMAHWYRGPAFDRILLDAPCSATGVIRRHPDIKLLRRPTDVAAAAVQQLALLHGLWPLLAPGGRLLYVTCSVLRAENEAVVAEFLRATPQAQELALPWTHGVAVRHGRQLLPQAGGGDGLYYCGLHKPG